MRKFAFYGAAIMSGVLCGLAVIALLATTNNSHYTGDIKGENTADPTDPTAVYRDMMSTCGKSANEPDPSLSTRCQDLITQVQEDKHATVHAVKTGDLWSYWVEYNS